jgi:DNA polymerase-3 subunit delta
LVDATTAAARIPVAPVYLLHGDEELRKRRAVAAVIERLVGGAGEHLDVERFEAGQSPTDAVLEALASPPLLSDARVVVVSEVQALSTADQRRLAQAIRSLPDGIHAVLVASAPEGRGRAGPPVSADLRGVVQERGKLYEFPVPKGRDLSEWVVKEAARRGKRIGGFDAQSLILAAGSDLATLASEIEKLATYVGGRERITREDIEAVAVKAEEYTIFNLVDAIGERKVERALSALPGILSADGDTGGALRVIAMVARQFRLLWQAKTLMDGGVNLQEAASAPADIMALLPKSPNVVDEVKRHRFLADRYATQARNFTRRQLASALDRIFQADCAVKGLTQDAMDGRAALESMIADLCRRGGDEDRA